MAARLWRRAAGAQSLRPARLMPIRLPRLAAAADAPFPDPARALEEPNGLLAFGGDLQVPRLLNAYRQGIFPWFSADEPILWWSPDPRCVFRTDAMHLPRRLRRSLRSSDWQLYFDTAFESVIDACAAPRTHQPGTWITRSMREAYIALHDAGHAHSVEVRSGDGGLVGGLYGVASGRMFFAESMFSAETNGSKAALFGLAALLRTWRCPLIDAQLASAHLASLGAILLPRSSFLAEARDLARQPAPAQAWQSPAPPLPMASLFVQDSLA